MSKKKEATPIVSQNEALQLISAQLRRTDLNPSQFAKLLNLQAKLSGWKPKKPREPKESSFDQMVMEAERKRKTVLINPISQENL
jgi:hypothetical protein